MADNTQLSPGAGGDLISTDDLGTEKVQRVKVQYGVDGSATDVSASNPMPCLVEQATHDSLNLNANLQVGDTDVGGGNPVPVSVIQVDTSIGFHNELELNDETSTTVVGAGGSGVRHMVDSVTICNASSVIAVVSILTATTAMYTVHVPGSGSVSSTFPTALRGGDNEDLKAQVQTSGFSEATPGGIYVNVSGFSD